MKDALTVTKSKFEVKAEGGNIEVEIKANVEYDFSISESAKSWITHKSTRAMETSTLVFNIAQNSDEKRREGKIYVYSENLKETITVYQEGVEPTIVLTQSEYNVSDEENTISVEVTSGVDVHYEIIDDVDWVREITSRAISTTAFKFEIAQNNGYDSRSARIRFYNEGENLEEYVTINQRQKDAIVLATESYTIAPDGGEIEVGIGHNVDFDVEIGCDWITQTSTRALEHETLVFTIAANSSTYDREGMIKFISKDEKVTQQVSIYQSGKNALEVSQNDIIIDDQAQTIEFEVRANVEYVVSEPSADWLHRQDTRGMNTQKYRYQVDENTTDVSRTATITIQSVDGTIEEVITITQSVPAKLKVYISSDSENTLHSHIANVFGANVTSIKKTGWDRWYVIRFKEGYNVIPEKAFLDRSWIEACEMFGIETIGNYAFRGCDCLESVTIPDSVTAIGDMAFFDCVSLESVTIPDSVTTIGDSVFSGCNGLTSVTIPDSVTTIGSYAFEGCYGLTSVTIPDSVTTIGVGAFAGCYGLIAFYGKYASNDNRCLIMEGNLIRFAPSGLTKYDVPESVTVIGSYAFSDCDDLTSVTIPDSVTTIGSYAFAGCYGLWSVTIPDSVTTIGDEAFSNCDDLTSVTIPDSVTTIGDEAFLNCDRLASVTIGSGVTSIGSRLFFGGANRRKPKVYIKATTPPNNISDSTFEFEVVRHDPYKVSHVNIYVPVESMQLYRDVLSDEIYISAYYF